MMGFDVRSWFTDPFLNYLKSYGYCPVRLPKSDLKPLQILFKKGTDLHRLGQLSTVLHSETISIPKIQENIQAANIIGQRTSDIKIGIGLNILGNILGAMGGSAIGIQNIYSNAKNIRFEFNDVFEDSVEIAILDTFLGDADFNPFSRYVTELLESNYVYIITSTIKSNKFTVISTSSHNEEIEVNVPEIQSIVGPKVKVIANSATASKLTYEGSVSLIFGFQAVRLFYDNGRYTALEPVTKGVALKGLENVPDDGSERLMVDEPFIKFNDMKSMET
jgi:hypothetical protein